ncbi:MAG: hypothetical protein DHS20C03_24180 [Minwuia thermotolerans]|nr:MAG: hypothetical protein DHS20C03_24180 [Minwuia thermotolerans]
MQVVIVPAVHIAAETAIGLEEADGRAVADPAGDFHHLPASAGADRHILAVGIAERRRVDEADMGRIAEIVRDVQEMAILTGGCSDLLFVM